MMFFLHLHYIHIMRGVYIYIRWAWTYDQKHVLPGDSTRHQGTPRKKGAPDLDRQDNSP